MELGASQVIDELHRKLGRNLLRFQEIEFSIKFFLPYVHPDGGRNGLDGLKQMRERVSERSLGLLIQDLKDSMEVSGPDFLSDELKKILDARNQLVHHFFQLPGVDFMTPEGIREAIRYLDRQFEELDGTYQLFKSWTFGGLLTILDSGVNEHPEFAAYREALLNRWPSNVEFIDQVDPTKTHWETTRIVRLLRLAETETKKVDGMTLLSNAGRFIRESDPEVCPREYGLRTFLEVLRASNLFEVHSRPHGSGNGVTVLYRSKS